jgi:hypothetical protein
MNGAHGPISMPDDLRDMRTFVHPAVMENAYQPEIELRPEAVTVGGLFGIGRYNIQ